MARRIHMVGVHGLLGGPNSLGYSLGIDAMFAKAKKLDPENISYTLTEQYEDPRTYTALVNAWRAGAILVGSGHSLGVPDIINAAHRLGREHGGVMSLAFTFDGTWNAPSPPVENSIRRAINLVGASFSFLGHDSLEKAEGYTGFLSNIPIRALHTNVDDDLGAHAMFLREIQWLRDPKEGSATLPQPVAPAPMPAETFNRYAPAGRTLYPGDDPRESSAT